MATERRFVAVVHSLDGCGVRVGGIQVLRNERWHNESALAATSESGVCAVYFPHSGTAPPLCAAALTGINQKENQLQKTITKRHTPKPAPRTDQSNLDCSVKAVKTTKIPRVIPAARRI